MADEHKLGEPWRCAACDAFMYNRRFIDGDLYPIEGAPPSKYLSLQYPRVCSLCFELHLILDTSEYWKRLESTKREENKKIKKLFPGSDYLTQ